MEGILYRAKSPKRVGDVGGEKASLELIKRGGAGEQGSQEVCC